jgi:hypothetical protein
MAKSDDYSKRELTLMFERVHEKLDDILVQTKSIDTRVALIESDVVPKVNLHDKVIIGGITLILIAFVGAIIKLVIL